VRVSLFADPIEVPLDEVPVLRAQGLLIEEPEPAADQPVSTTRSAPAARKDSATS
jgi:hypothetical protein